MKFPRRSACDFMVMTPKDRRVERLSAVTPPQSARHKRHGTDYRAIPTPITRTRDRVRHRDIGDGGSSQIGSRARDETCTTQ